MKKYQILIALMCSFILSQKLNAQIPELFIHEWELDRLIIDGDEIFPPINDEVSSVRILFDETPNDNPDTPYSITGNVCDAFFSSVIFEQDNATETLRMGFDYAATQGGCAISENLSFQGTYFTFYVQFIEDPYEYQITFSGDDSLTLEIFSPNGDVAIYNNLVLSLDDQLNTTFSVFPNPVQDQLFIETENGLGNYTVVVYDMLGKTLLTTSKEAILTNPIQVSDWTSGMYFLRIQDENGSVTTKRFVKS